MNLDNNKISKKRKILDDRDNTLERPSKINPTEENIFNTFYHTDTESSYDDESDHPESDNKLDQSNQRNSFDKLNALMKIASDSTIRIKVGLYYPINKCYDIEHNYSSKYMYPKFTEKITFESFKESHMTFGEMCEFKCPDIKKIRIVDKHDITIPLNNFTDIKCKTLVNRENIKRKYIHLYHVWIYIDVTDDMESDVMNSAKYVRIKYCSELFNFNKSITFIIPYDKYEKILLDNFTKLKYISENTTKKYLTYISSHFKYAIYNSPYTPYIPYTTYIMNIGSVANIMHDEKFNELRKKSFCDRYIELLSHLTVKYLLNQNKNKTIVGKVNIFCAIFCQSRYPLIYNAKSMLRENIMKNELIKHRLLNLPDNIREYSEKDMMMKFFNHIEIFNSVEDIIISLYNYKKILFNNILKAYLTNDINHINYFEKMMDTNANNNYPIINLSDILIC